MHIKNLLFVSSCLMLVSGCSINGMQSGLPEQPSYEELVRRVLELERYKQEKIQQEEEKRRQEEAKALRTKQEAVRKRQEEQEATRRFLEKQKRIKEANDWNAELLRWESYESSRNARDNWF